MGSRPLPAPPRRAGAWGKAGPMADRDTPAIYLKDLTLWTDGNPSWCTSPVDQSQRKSVHALNVTFSLSLFFLFWFLWLADGGKLGVPKEMTEALHSLQGETMPFSAPQSGLHFKMLNSLAYWYFPGNSASKTSHEEMNCCHFMLLGCWKQKDACVPDPRLICFIHRWNTCSVKETFHWR